MNDTEERTPDEIFEEAVHAYVAAETKGGMAVDWIFFASHTIPGADNFDATGYEYTFRKGQPYHSTRGLADTFKSGLDNIYGRRSADDEE